MEVFIKVINGLVMILKEDKRFLCIWLFYYVKNFSCRFASGSEILGSSPTHGNTQPHQIFLRPVDLRQTSKNRKRSLFITRKAQGILALLLCKKFLPAFPLSCEPLRDEFHALISHVRLSLKEDKLNFNALISYFEAISLLFLTEP